MKHKLILLAALLLHSMIAAAFAIADETLTVESETHPQSAAISISDGTSADVPRMLEQNVGSQHSNACLNSLMAAGCRISSQIPFWNHFVASFMSQAGIACPIANTIHFK